MRTPESFATVEEHDAYFDSMREELQTLIAPDTERLEEQRGNPKSCKTACRNELEALYEKRDKQLAEIEAKECKTIIQSVDDQIHTSTPE